MAVPAIMEIVTHEDALRPLDRPWTVDDLDELPDDGRRFEIVDGSLHVTPAPDYLHAQVATRMLWPLHPVLPAELEIILGAGVHRHDELTRYLEPDLMVVRRRTEWGPPLAGPEEAVLVVEVLSPSSVTHDRVTSSAVPPPMTAGSGLRGG